jgi:Kef-type K+ transport system membrane component KefB
VVSFSGIAAPMALGGLLGWAVVADGGFFPGRVAGWQGALFIAAAIAITAFPMLAWIVYDSNLLHTRLGTMALACAAADDAVAWILLAGVGASTKGSAAIAVVALLGSVAYLAVMLTVVRRLLRRLNDYATAKTRQGEGLPSGVLVSALLIVLVGAWLTDLIGVYAVFGAFIAGIVMPRGPMTTRLRERLEPLTAYLLLPAFFVYSGLNTRLTLLFEPGVLVALIVVLAVAVIGKGVSVAIAARVQGLPWREAGSLGALMNARGLMELILLNVGLTAGIVTPELYTILAIMTIVTTFAASPLHLFRGRALRTDAPAEPALQPIDHDLGRPKVDALAGHTWELQNDT